MKNVLTKIHNMTCPAWLLGIKKMQSICPGCKAAMKAKR